ncbi:E3 ubiquitin-protein ligase MBR2 [Arachis hypogaea]|nr:E3 ubiquitin-protein ligase MBR2 [Arachis hypogaea]XP_029148222.1 E3 ubiquitin-protein ligase MBR2 [Arachis hypogaea]QHO53630.1 E3 ubiquitin-protein ligase [Arachis hypogaea]
MKWWVSMPKVELHTHLNGSIRDSTLLELIKALGEKGVINFSQVEHIIMKCICIMKKSRLLVHLAKQCLVACPVMKKNQICQVLIAMRRGDNLRAEDYMLFDPFIYHGMAELHDRHREMRLGVDNTSYEELLALEERIGDVSTGLSEDVIMKSMKQQIYMSVMAESSTDLEPCCICQVKVMVSAN